MSEEREARTWIITGASSGLGLALARAALDAGERVAGTARQVARLGPLRDAYGDRFLGVGHDVRDVGGAAGVVDAATQAFGRVDVLVSNAGAGQVGTVEEITGEALADMIAQHLLGPAAYVRAVLPGMRAAGRGAIVAMSSQGGRMSFPAVGSYSAAKFALEGWSEALAGEVAPFGIRVLIVEPSRFRTQFNAPGVLRAAPPDPRYAAVTGGIRADMAGADGRQEGDPDRAAAAIRAVLDKADPPLRLPLGREAVSNLTAAYQRSLAEVRRWAQVSESADFPGLPPAARAFQQAAASCLG